MLLKSEIEEVYKEQQSMLYAKDKSIKRNKFDQVTNNNDFVQIISGIRRCGKSTLLHQLMSKYKKIAYLNFEDPRILNFEVSDFIKLEEIIPKDTQAYFFDEIQNVVKWEIFVRKLHDNKKKVYITGSNASLLSKDLGTRLTGRYLNAELFPFSFNEFLEFSKSSKSVQSVEKYLEKGGFPEYLKQQNTEVLQNLLKDIVLRDIAIRYGIRNIKTLMDIALFLLSNVGKESTYNGLKKTFEVGSANTVLDYLTWLEDAYLLFFLQKFSWSAKSRNINPRKVYAIDNGFITANSLSFSKDKGRLLENAVYLHYRSKGLQMYYFKEKQECDFVLFKNNTCQSVIQVCYELNSDNKEREINGLLEAMDFFDLKEGNIITLKQNDVLTMGNKKVKIIPMLEFLCT
jgi:uncharacterized protein